MSGRSTAVRFSWVGLDTARKALENMGEAGAQALREIDAAAKGPTASMKALDTAASQVNGVFDDLKGRGGAAGNVLGALGPLGNAAAIGLGAAAVAAGGLWVAFEQAATRADDFADAADRLDIDVEALQSYRFLLEEIGGSSQDADAGLEALNQRIGQVRLGLRGAEQSVKVFAALGIPEDVVKSWNSAEDGLSAIAQGVANIKNEAERAKILEALNLTAWGPAFREGAAGFEELANKGREAGNVMSREVVQGLGDTKRQMEITSGAIATSLSSALVSLGPTFNWLLQRVRDVIQGIGDMVNFFNQGMAKIEDKNTRQLQATIRESQRAQRAEGEAMARLRAERDAMLGVDPGDGTRAPGGGRDAAYAASRATAYRLAEMRRNQAAERERAAQRELEGRSDYVPIELKPPPVVADRTAPTLTGGGGGGGAARTPPAPRSGGGAAARPRAGKTPRERELEKAEKDRQAAERRELDEAARFLDSYVREVEKAEPPTEQLRVAMSALALAAEKIPERAEDARKGAAQLAKEFAATAIDAENFKTETSTILADPAVGQALSAYTAEIAKLSAQVRAGTLDQESFGRIVEAETAVLMLQARAADEAAQALARLKEEKARLPEVPADLGMDEMEANLDRTLDKVRAAGLGVQDTWRGARDELEESNVALRLLLDTSRQLPRTWEDFGRIALQVLTDIIAKSAQATWGEGGTGGGLMDFGKSVLGSIFNRGGGTGSGGGFSTPTTVPVGGARARGGPVAPGFAYQVNEPQVRPVSMARPDMEWFMPKTHGAVWNPEQLSMLSKMAAQNTGGGGQTVIAQTSIKLINQTGVPMENERGPAGANGEQTYILKKMISEQVRGTVGDMGKDGTLGRVLSSSRKPIKR